MENSTKQNYDVALSFAGENREYVGAVAAALRSAGAKVFYDEFESATLWGKDLYEYLATVYEDASTVTVVFLDESYADKAWTRHELRSAQARAFRERREYVLPVRFDETKFPGIPATIGYIDGLKTAPGELAAMIMAKLELLRATGVTDDENG